MASCKSECLDSKKLCEVIPTCSVSPADVQHEGSRVISDGIDVTDWGARGGVGPLKKPVQSEVSLVSGTLDLITCCDAVFST